MYGKNNDISSTKNFYKYLDEKRENLADLLKWRSLGGTMLNEKLPEGYEQACFGLLKEFMPEKVKDFELSKECYKAFKKDVEVNGYQPTAYLMSNYYYMMEKGEERLRQLCRKSPRSILRAAQIHWLIT